MKSESENSGAEFIPDRGPLRKWAKIRLWTGYIYIALALVFAHPQPTWVITGFFLVLVGIAFRLVASATLVKDRELCTTGIYSVTRNPLYFGSALLGLGFASIASSVWFLAGYILVLVPIYMRMIVLEEIFLSRIFPGTFADYMKNVPRFFPTRWTRDLLLAKLDLDKLVRSKELFSSFIFILLVFLILGIHRTWLP